MYVCGSRIQVLNTSFKKRKNDDDDDVNGNGIFFLIHSIGFRPSKLTD